jgi:hypothetical protein
MLYAYKINLISKNLFKLNFNTVVFCFLDASVIVPMRRQKHQRKKITPKRNVLRNDMQAHISAFQTKRVWKLTRSSNRNCNPIYCVNTSLPICDSRYFSPTHQIPVSSRSTLFCWITDHEGCLLRIWLTVHTWPIVARKLLLRLKLGHPAANKQLSRRN